MSYCVPAHGALIYGHALTTQLTRLDFQQLPASSSLKWNWRVTSLTDREREEDSISRYIIHIILHKCISPAVMPHGILQQSTGSSFHVSAQLLVANYCECCQTVESYDRLSTCWVSECLTSEICSNRWSGTHWLAVRSALVKSELNLSCPVWVADQYQLYYKWSRATSMSTVSTCT